jgi:hypothetical protein
MTKREPSDRGGGPAPIARTATQTPRLVEIDLVGAPADDRPSAHWTSTMVGVRGSWSDSLRDTSFMRPPRSDVPAEVREYRAFAREAFLWSRDAGYARRVARAAWLAPLVQSAVAAKCALGRGNVGRPRIAQFRDMRRLAEAGVRPWDYHRFGLYERTLHEASHAVSARESTCVHLALHQHVDFKSVDDKERLQATLTRAALPTPVTVCRIDASTAPELVADLLPSHDLFVKRVDYGWGIGAEAFRRVAAVDAWLDGAGRTLTRAALVRHLCVAARAFPLLVQRRLANGPSTRDLSPGGLSTLRVVTMRASPGAVPHVLVAILRMTSTAKAITDNFAGGGLAAEYDLATGTLGAARRKDSFAATFERHPATGAPIAGRRIDEGASAVALATAAHALFPNMLTVGWDIALSDAGPTILEGNLLWCTELVQCVTRRPLLLTEYGAAAFRWIRESRAFR